MSCVKINYALKDDKIVSILDIPIEERGLKCNCICPECKGKLSAKLGFKNQHHFAHSANSICDPKKATQTALHILAKEIIEEERTMNFPPYFVEFSDTNIYKTLEPEDKFRFKSIFKEPYEIIKQQYVKFDAVALEKVLCSIVPDIIGITNNKKCIIEIAVFHFVDEEKKAKLENLNLPVIEIDLKSLIKNPLSIHELKSKIIKDIDCKKWIFNPKVLFKLPDADLYFQKEIKKITENNDKKYKEIRRTHNTKEISLDRNDSSFFDYYKKTGLYKECPIPPFFLDIPIEDENCINHDRRIWQSLIFEFLVIKQNTCKNIKYLDIEDFILDMLSFPTTKYSPTVTKIINTFLLHLNYLGFIKYSCNNLANTDGYIHISIPNSYFIPPNELYSTDLNSIIKNADPCSLETTKKVSSLLSKNIKT